MRNIIGESKGTCESAPPPPRAASQTDRKEGQAGQCECVATRLSGPWAALFEGAEILLTLISAVVFGAFRTPSRGRRRRRQSSGGSDFTEIVFSPGVWDRR